MLQSSELPLQTKTERPIVLAGSQTDITIAAEVYLLYNVLHDSLTQLPNRVLFMDRLGYVIKRPRT